MGIQDRNMRCISGIVRYTDGRDSGVDTPPDVVIGGLEPGYFITNVYASIFAGIDGVTSGTPVLRVFNRNVAGYYMEVEVSSNNGMCYRAPLEADLANPLAVGTADVPVSGSSEVVATLDFNGVTFSADHPTAGVIPVVVEYALLNAPDAP